MFKLFFQKRLRLVPGLTLLLLTACNTTPLPQADLKQPGWRVAEGQAVWRKNKNAAEIAGEILLATNNSGATLVQFTKTPFPLVTAQTTTNAWQIEAPAQNRRFSHNGAPPPGIIWFQLSPALLGETLPSRWRWKKAEANWRLENRWTGESLEGYFNQ